MAGRWHGPDCANGPGPGIRPGTIPVECVDLESHGDVVSSMHAFQNLDHLQVVAIIASRENRNPLGRVRHEGGINALIRVIRLGSLRPFASSGWVFAESAVEVASRFQFA